MLHEDPGKITYSDIGGLNEQIREVRETIELPLTNPGLFERVGIKAPKVGACQGQSVWATRYAAPAWGYWSHIAQSTPRVLCDTFFVCTAWHIRTLSLEAYFRISR